MIVVLLALALTLSGPVALTCGLVGLAARVTTPECAARLVRLKYLLSLGEGMRILGIVGSPSRGGRTAAVVGAVLAAAAAQQDVETDLLALSDYDIAFADGTSSTDWTGDTRAVLTRVEQADAFVFGTPVYREGATGRMKNLLDLIPRGVWDGPTAPLQGKPVGVVVTGASTEHFLAMHDLQGKLTSFFAAYVVPLGVYASGDFAAPDGTITDAYLAGRSVALGQALVALTRAIGDSSALRDVEPQVKYPSIALPAEGPTGAR